MTNINFHGIEMPNIGLGTWHMGSDPLTYREERDVIRMAVDNGVQAIDTAEMYGRGDAERLVGDALSEYDRSKIFLISKFYPRNAVEPQLSAALEASLKRLQTDYLDLYLYHWRGDAPLEQTVADLQALKKSGKIRHWGVSNFDIDDMTELVDVPGGDQVFANEDLYNIGERGIEYSLLPWQRKRDIPLIAYSPVDAGDSRQHELLYSPGLIQIAERHDATPYQILLAWAVRDQQTLAIPQTSNPEHLMANIHAGDIHLTKVDLDVLDQSFPGPSKKEPLAII
ncbi:aldo/keto reductase [Lactobacillaceae bacterium L1_55_11]|nr:aldo/keto reductase [Lactobacillaceae bacterium L1_55_11]